jgi:hypothetical protein
MKYFSEEMKDSPTDWTVILNNGTEIHVFADGVGHEEGLLTFSLVVVGSPVELSRMIHDGVNPYSRVPGTVMMRVLSIPEESVTTWHSS